MMPVGYLPAPQYVTVSGVYKLYHGGEGGHSISLDKVKLGQQVESLIVHARIVLCGVSETSGVSEDDPHRFPSGRGSLWSTRRRRERKGSESLSREVNIRKSLGCRSA